MMPMASSQPGADSYTSEEYWSWLHSKASPSTVRKFDPRYARVSGVGSGRPRIQRKLSADSLMDYKTYQQELQDTAQQYTNMLQSMSRGYKTSHSSSSLSNLAMAAGSATTKSRQYDTEGKNIPPPTSRVKDLELSRKPIQIKIEDFKLYKPDSESKKKSALEPGSDGVLSLHIYCGHGLKSSKTILRDLYCVVEVDSVNKARTMIRTGAINFDWDEAFDMELEGAQDISFLVYNWDPNARHRLCFTGKINLQRYLQQFGKVGMLALKLEPKGILYFRLVYREPAVTLQRKPSVHKQALFGVDLEMIIKREKTGLNVPVLVRKCVEEVDKRGLDIVGIYRLCGSAKRKTKLRQEFESNPMGVDISAETVMDINVITGRLNAT